MSGAGGIKPRPRGRGPEAGVRPMSLGLGLRPGAGAEGRGLGPVAGGREPRSAGRCHEHTPLPGARVGARGRCRGQGAVGRDCRLWPGATFHENVPDEENKA